ncbi:MAG: aldose 1-epimerase [Dongiaceae bacterium]
MSLVTLHVGSAGLSIAPECGGSIARYWRDLGDHTIEWLRPAVPGALERRDPLGMACFPLVPYSSLIRLGRFTFQGRQVSLPLNFAPSRHSIHGHGWKRPWSVVNSTTTAATIEYRHRSDEWPWPYRAEQRFELRPERMSIRMSVTNEGREPMPAGLGPHPYFVRTPTARLTAAADRIWLNDRELLPTELVAPPPEYDLRGGIHPVRIGMDHCFAAWNRRATIDWPEWHARLEMIAEAPLDFLVVYTPPDTDHFCVEPVSNITDAFNLTAAGRIDTGMRVLQPGETLTAVAHFEPHV